MYPKNMIRSTWSDFGQKEALNMMGWSDYGWSKHPLPLDSDKSQRQNGNPNSTSVSSSPKEKNQHLLFSLTFGLKWKTSSDSSDGHSNAARLVQQPPLVLALLALPQHPRHGAQQHQPRRLRAHPRLPREWLPSPPQTKKNRPKGTRKNNSNMSPKEKGEKRRRPWMVGGICSPNNVYTMGLLR